MDSIHQQVFWFTRTEKHAEYTHLPENDRRILRYALYRIYGIVSRRIVSSQLDYLFTSTDLLLAAGGYYYIINVSVDVCVGTLTDVRRNDKQTFDLKSVVVPTQKQYQTESYRSSLNIQFT